MNEALVFIAYGLLLLGGSFMTIFWGRVALKRLREVGVDCFLERYCTVATSLTLSSIGTSIFFGARTYSFMQEGVTTVSYSGPIPIVVLIGLYTIVAAKTGLIWAVHLRGNSWIWRAYLGLTTVWIALASVWVWVDPLSTYPY